MVERAAGWDCKNFLLRLFQVNINSFGQASILAEADSNAVLFFSRVAKVFLFLRKQMFLFSQGADEFS